MNEVGAEHDESKWGRKKETPKKQKGGVEAGRVNSVRAWVQE